MLTLIVGSRECVSISIVDDETPENSEVFLVVLTNSSDVDLGISLAQIQIEDDDIGIYFTYTITVVCGRVVECDLCYRLSLLGTHNYQLELYLSPSTIYIEDNDGE